MLANSKSNPFSWVQKELNMKPVCFQNPVFSNQSSNALIKAMSNPDSLHTTQRGAGCPACVLPLPSLTALFMSRLEHCAFTSGCGQAGASDSVLPLAGVEVTGGGTSLPAKISHLWWHRPFCQHLLHAGWNIIWLRPGGETFPLQIHFPVSRGCFQVLNREPRPLTALCWHHHSASSCSIAGGEWGPSGCFPATNSCTFPSREVTLVPGRWPGEMVFGKTCSKEAELGGGDHCRGKNGGKDSRKETGQWEMWLAMGEKWEWWKRNERENSERSSSITL